MPCCVRNKPALLANHRRFYHRHNNLIRVWGRSRFASPRPPHLRVRRILVVICVRSRRASVREENCHVFAFTELHAICSVHFWNSVLRFVRPQLRIVICLRRKLLSLSLVIYGSKIRACKSDIVLAGTYSPLILWVVLSVALPEYCLGRGVVAIGESQ